MPELNVYLLRKLQERLRDEARVEAFNMTSWLYYRENIDTTDWDPKEAPRANACGTSACIAGHVALMENVQFTTGPGGDVLPPPDQEIYPWSRMHSIWVSTPAGDMTINQYARQKLGLTGPQADALFNLYGVPERLRYLPQVTAEQAVQAIDNLIATGDPKWGEIL